MVGGEVIDYLDVLEASCRGRKALSLASVRRTTGLLARSQSVAVVLFEPIDKSWRTARAKACQGNHVVLRLLVHRTPPTTRSAVLVIPDVRDEALNRLLNGTTGRYARLAADAGAIDDNALFSAVSHLCGDDFIGVEYPPHTFMEAMIRTQWDRGVVR